MGVIKLTEQNFEDEVLKSPIPVLVDFWAEWCGPCRMMGPIIDEIAEELKGKIKVGKVNVDEASQLAAQFNIASIPSIFIFKNKELVDQIIGAIPKASLIQKIISKI